MTNSKNFITGLVLVFLAAGITGCAILEPIEVRQKNYRKAVPVIRQSFASKQIRPGDTWKIYLNAFHPDGDIKNKDGQISGVQAIMENISDKKKLESQLTQSQKMEAIGTLAGGIAHDFNNILSAIMGYTELAVLGVPEKLPAKQNLQEVLKASHRAKDLVRQILTFSRQGEQERKPVLIFPIVKETLKLLRASLPSTIEIPAKN